MALLTLEFAVRAVREGERDLVLRAPLVEAAAVHPLRRASAAARRDQRVGGRLVGLEADAAGVVVGDGGVEGGGGRLLVGHAVRDGRSLAG